ncbi:MAG: hypothetical protein LBF85_04605, partial [Tannerella sp.]|nr:hypothetical protein [Tannerella sp.]
MKVRSYNCKDEELPIVGKYILASLKRDLKDFISQSPLFSEDYVLKFDQNVRECAELVPPESDLATLKTVTARLHETMRNMNAPVGKLSIYLKLAKADAPRSVAEFGV